MGRNNKYQTHVLPHLEDIPKWYETMSETQIAKKLGIARSSWENYKTKYPELVNCLKKGKDILVEELRDSLRAKAKGYYYTETKDKYEPNENGELMLVERVELRKYAAPDTGAIHLLLKNLDEDWRNDDYKTMKMKEQDLELKKQKVEDEAW